MITLLTSEETEKQFKVIQERLKSEGIRSGIINETCMVLFSRDDYQVLDEIGAVCVTDDADLSEELYEQALCSLHQFNKEAGYTQESDEFIGLRYSRYDGISGEFMDSAEYYGAYSNEYSDLGEQPYVSTSVMSPLDLKDFWNELSENEDEIRPLLEENDAYLSGDLNRKVGVLANVIVKQDNCALSFLADDNGREFGYRNNEAALNMLREQFENVVDFLDIVNLDKGINQAMTYQLFYHLIDFIEADYYTEGY